MTLRNILIDGVSIDVPPEYTLLQACEAAGVQIPRFCFHDRLSIAGNCRMCLIEIKGGPPKPAASCAMNVRDLRPGPEGQPPEIFTSSEMVHKARRGVMEFLLINHPLDCPICDQGGECDLQDQAMAYGFDSSRYKENKRAVEDKHIGPLIKTVMTRCIHCTRCVRFTSEVCGVSDLGLIGRGEDAQITSYLQASLSSELQGNLVDLCPVGALTHRPTAFQARPWEMKKTETVDVMDALGSAICVSVRGREITRITPRLNQEINEEWLSDKGRYICDGLRVQRLDRPYIREGGRLNAVSWPEALAAAARALGGLKGGQIGAIAGDLASVEEMYALKMLMAQLGSPHHDCRQDGAALNPRLGRDSYLFNASIAGIDEADAILFIGANPRHEAPVLNARIRKRWRQQRIDIAMIGEAVDLTYPYQHLGRDAAILGELHAGQHPFAKILKKAVRPMIIVGQGALTRADGMAVASRAAGLAQQIGALSADWNGYCVLHTAAARVGGLDIGLVPDVEGYDTRRILDEARSGEIGAVILLGADELTFPVLDNCTTIYIGSHGDQGAHHADIILPGATYCEKSGIWVNMEGRVQLGMQAGFPPGEARPDWSILRALAGALGLSVGFDTLSGLRQSLFKAYPHLEQFDILTRDSDLSGVEALISAAGPMTGEPVRNVIDDYYLTNPIARASQVMAECSRNRSQMLGEAAE